MRFILYFFLYGILFYILSQVFPDVFFKMVEWARSITELLYGIYTQLAMKLHEWVGTGKTLPHRSLEQSLPFVLQVLLRGIFR